MEIRKRSGGGACAAGPMDDEWFTPDDVTAFAAADCLDHVEAAWRLVYQRYLAAGFIAPNRFRLHTTLHALRADTCVVLGQCGGRVTSTMTMTVDGGNGLSLDQVYCRELQSLRGGRRRLLEVGLLVADGNANLRRDMSNLFELMKWGVYYALHLNITDIVIGVHPRHAMFYTHCFAFEQFAPETVYPMVGNKPVVPLRLRVEERMALQVLPRGLRHVCEKPVERNAFSNRYMFSKRELDGSAVGRFVASLQPVQRPTGRPAAARRKPSQIGRAPTASAAGCPALC